MNILVVGGAGYIGSHICKALKKAGFTPVVFDNFQKGHAWAVQWGPMMQGDILQPAALDLAFKTFQPEAVIHLAALIDCRESAQNPGKYYQNNVAGSLSLFQAMVRSGVTNIIFSSTAAVYGLPKQTPIPEEDPCSPINVYGKTKFGAEVILTDFHQSHGIRSVILRYFNAAGADESGQIGEAHTPETHLIPLAILAALGKQRPLKIFGEDHATPDGSPIRDFIHVSDLANAHVLALQWLLKGGAPLTLNLGSGKGSSVREVLSMIEHKLGRKVPSELAAKNLSDPPILIAAIAQAQKVLNWTPKHDLESIIATALHWHDRS